MRGHTRGVTGLARSILAISVASCFAVPTAEDTNPDAAAGLPSGAAVGQACNTAVLCRPGLACTNGACQPGASSPVGTACVICSECTPGDYCGPARTCGPGGTGQSGQPCESDGDCSTGLRCDLVGLAAECAPQGMSDVGGTCTTSGDCFCGLACVTGACAPLPPNPSGLPPLAIPTWPGATCTDDPAPTKAYFRVPRGTADDGDFYRLPFPNDVRRKAGHPDLSNHPTPGPELLGFDVVDRYLRYVEQSTDGFSTYPTVIFRFNASISFDSLGEAGSLRWSDVTPGASGGDLGLGYEVTTGRGAYLCANSVSIRPPQGHPLVPGHTYAVLMSNQVQDGNNVPVAASPDFSALVSASAPGDPALAAPYAAYKPLRDWAAAKGVSLSSYIDGTVFTVAHATAEASNLAAAAMAAPVATASGWVNCAKGPSPCPQAAATDGRACPATPNPAFDELHALLTLPIFQQGDEPYLTPTDGGDLVLGAGGVPAVQRTEQVCMALTVPRGAMPASGWPLVVFAHGTGGSFRSFVDSNLPQMLGSVSNGMGQTVSMAVLSIDEVEHGTRRGSSQSSPDDLFFNFANPAAARGNPLQGGADQVALLRFAQSLDLSASRSPTGNEIKFGSVAYWGHSQGSTEGGILLGYVSGYAGVVFSGQGASLVDALVTKKNPVDVSAAVPFVLEETSGVDAYHPVLGILQNAIDPDDPLNHAGTFTVPPAMVTARHVLQPYGLGDTYAPPVTEQTFAIAAALGLAAPSSGVTTPDPIGGLIPLAVPVGGNLMVNAKPVTAIVREYMPTSAYDGHFVAFDNPDAEKDVANFLADAVTGLVPKVGR